MWRGSHVHSGRWIHRGTLRDATKGLRVVLRACEGGRPGKSAHELRLIHARSVDVHVERSRRLRLMRHRDGVESVTSARANSERIIFEGERTMHGGIMRWVWCLRSWIH